MQTTAGVGGEEDHLTARVSHPEARHGPRDPGGTTGKGVVGELCPWRRRWRLHVGGRALKDRPPEV